MGQLLKGPNQPTNATRLGHNCWYEIPKTGRELLDKSNRLEDQPIGMVFRCDCGKLWHTVKDMSSWSKWKRAGWILRFKYRNDGLGDNGQF
jgi:hypothetical protein